MVFYPPSGISASGIKELREEALENPQCLQLNSISFKPNPKSERFSEREMQIIAECFKSTVGRPQPPASKDTRDGLVPPRYRDLG